MHFPSLFYWELSELYPIDVSFTLNHFESFLASNLNFLIMLDSLYYETQFNLSLLKFAEEFPLSALQSISASTLKHSWSIFKMLHTLFFDSNETMHFWELFLYANLNLTYPSMCKSILLTSHWAFTDMCSAKLSILMSLTLSTCESFDFKQSQFHLQVIWFLVLNFQLILLTLEF